MPGQFSRQDQALDRGAALVSDARADLEQQLSALRGKLAGIGSQWLGGGSTAFQALMVRWDDDARRIVTALNGFEANLRSSEQTYSASDEAQSTSYAHLASRLG